MRFLDFVSLLALLGTTAADQGGYGEQEVVAETRFNQMAHHVPAKHKTDRVAQTAATHARPPVTDPSQQAKMTSVERHHPHAAQNELQRRTVAETRFNQMAHHVPPKHKTDRVAQTAATHARPPVTKPNQQVNLKPHQHHSPQSNELRRILKQQQQQHREHDRPERIATAENQHGRDQFGQRIDRHDRQEKRVVPDEPSNSFHPRRVTGLRSSRDVSEGDRAVSGRGMTWEKAARHAWNALAMTTAARVALETTALSTLGPVGLLVAEEAVRRLGAACIPSMIAYLKSTDWRKTWPFSFPRPEYLPGPAQEETPKK